MIELGDRLILDDGTVLCSDAAIVELLYSGRGLDSAMALPSDDIELYNAADRLLDTGYGNIDVAAGEIYDGVDWFSHWLTPAPWSSMDVGMTVLSRCQTEAEFERVQIELVLFEQRKMMSVLRHLMYLVDHWRQAGILWGVGRGSSVGSLVLYLIGINRINPLDFDLGIDEFLK
jgi:hypothetical protein